MSSPAVSAERRVPARHWTAGFGGALLVVTAGCAVWTEPTHIPSAATRPATKDTCPDVRWDPPPALGIEQTRRELVGFAPTVLGVETTWAGGGISVQTVAGGYVDDITEPFDDLTVVGHRSLSGGIEAEVLRGSLQEMPVLVVVWRDPSVQVPCDVHALVAVGADGAREAEVLAGLR
jgi:hypothetical protein